MIPLFIISIFSAILVWATRKPSYTTNQTYFSDSATKRSNETGSTVKTGSGKTGSIKRRVWY